MASRTPSRRPSGGRSSSRSSRSSRSSSSSSNQMPMILGGVAALVLVVALVVMNSGGGKDDGGDGGSNKQQAKTPAKQPAPKTKLKLGAAQAGTTPDEPAPALTVETLQKMRDQYSEAKKLGDEGIRLTKEGKKAEARTVLSQAKVKIDAIKAMVDAQLTWQEKADFGDWAQPAEYTTLSAIYGKLARLDKTVRMNGGK